jgi:fatty acid kinase
VELDTVRTLARAALQNLEAHRQRIDDLNVYPVPDGDTGTNLTLTLRSMVETLEESSAEESDAVAKVLSHAALLGARGNSGVIFSQVLRGFVEGLGEAPAPSADDLSGAFRVASDAAYRAVKHPVEGTMLTVIREMAEEAEKEEHEGLSPVELVDAVLARGEDALARTPDMLDVLGKAGVVDAGGAGLLEIVRGAALAAAGRPLPEGPLATEALSYDAIHQELSRFRYCTVFVVEGHDLDLDELERTLEPMGDSLLVVGDESALKIHVHTDDPGAALSAGTAIGVVEGIEIANLHDQTLAREGRLSDAGPIPTLETGLVAVCAGQGNRRLFESLGATRVIEGGQTMNPSTADILAAIEATPATEVIVLPNNANVILATEQAASLSAKSVRVVPSRSLQAGLAAMGRYVPTNPAAQNEQEMLEALASAVTGEVTIASRDAELDGVAIREGDYLGLVDEKAVTSHSDVAEVAREVIEQVLAGERSWLGILTGENPPPLAELIEAFERSHPEVEFEVHDGGQPHYPLLVVAE